MLKRLYCDNYKCLVNFELELSPLQLFLGRNGSGKSTIFEVLELLRDFSARGENCEGRLVGPTLTRWQNVEQQTFELEVVGNGGVYTYRLELTDWGPNAQPKVRKESVTCDGLPLFLVQNGILHLYSDHGQEKVTFPYDFKKSGLAIVEARNDNKRLTWFKKWLDRIYFLQIDPRRMSAKAEREAPFPSFDLSNFAEWYRHLRLDQGKAMKELQTSLEGIIQGFSDLSLKQAGVNTRVLQVEADIGNKTAIFEFDELSDGQRALIGLYAVVHSAPAAFSLICVDEPENFVALSEIQPLLALICDLQIENVQVLTASHHPEVLNQLATGSGVLLNRLDGRHTVARKFDAHQQTTLTPAEIVARGWELV